jgi:hypothetical protein
MNNTALGVILICLLISFVCRLVTDIIAIKERLKKESDNQTA